MTAASVPPPPFWQRVAVVKLGSDPAMVDKLPKPPRKNPLVRTRVATVPPMLRSRAALAFSVRAARGELQLQHCSDCGAIAYPARDVCDRCWSADLVWMPVSDRGQLLAITVLESSTNVYFRERLPWRIGTVRVAEQVSVVMHVHQDVAEGDAVHIIARTDQSGQGVMMALPLGETPHMEDDPQLRVLGCSPKDRRVLITDVRSPSGQAMARSAIDAGAAKVFAGVADSWKPDAKLDALLGEERIKPVDLNVTHSDSVRECASSIGHKVDILINTAAYVRPGGALDQPLIEARREMETNYFGLLRLLQHFAPVMRSRGADGTHGAVCWANWLSVYALSNWPAHGTSSASQSAALSLAQAARAEFAGSGVKLLNVFYGPLEDPWYQPQSPPLVTPKKLASVTVSALNDGLEEAVVGDIANDVVTRWREDPGVLEKELQSERSVE
ncbi:MAG: SDR family NAD(P)-dependent oxidoreductase [Lysobacterales bacterium]